MTRTVVVIGASGYVGGRMLAELSGRGHRVVAVTRGDIHASSGASAHAERMRDDQLVSLRGEDVVVVNLAYPSNTPGLEARAANERLIERVRLAVEQTDARRLLHASTQAVFGYQWRSAPVAGPAPRRAGDMYIEVKQRAERALARHQRRRGHDLAIVRLGNVLGAGAMPWASATAQRILEGRPAAGRGGAGRLNGTYVANIADYFATLVEHDGEPAAGEAGMYHHLAEFGDRPWRDLIEPLAAAVGVEAVYTDDAPMPAAAGLEAMARAAVRRAAPLITRAPALVAMIQRLRPPLPLRTHGRAVEDPSWAMLTGGAIVFPPALLPGWAPPHSWNAALAEMQAWVAAHGYAVGDARR